ncbi:methylthioribose-1-phosphate isomerase [Nilaparvata lugens]|uniref:methylthioribose-1-phosphate isomerase n=1 Tax=Nilaparvata lugens TaxID=108931 RepID=UPI00193E1C11|nr:methylthioribose-1-phosphate isomerase [Nilaparvata lugens]XP_039290839.1 methylthioribose-1-phosphate isomerase [Nilaparvata lugens]XP_039290840.1 methylthioribose-1-phosphate isomerase [Nilaparvata lugens]XP_039290841.1 methylthioribose-1-phosphate isomerase [Nilaparvata lugens]XP_039290842.1 methylthioribose-1-phosphate isomerase [Nilaparvata lugens]XP_039290843.1 methylthioribose-1-phosphate isomerase [Nilaparvata lugens]
MSLEAIQYDNGKLRILDQLLLPTTTKYIDIENVEDGWKAIHSMQVRGAPAIALVGSLSLAVQLLKASFTDKTLLRQQIEEQMNFLITARPTAVNLKNAATDLIALATKLEADGKTDVDEMKSKFVFAIEEMLIKDIADNMAIGEVGAKTICKNDAGEGLVTILTHCNTGSLATAGYGTALGVIRALKSANLLEHVYCTETRPYNQGARLTAYELVHEKIPSTLVCDSAVAALMRTKKVTAAIVGADRITANGDTANKIGTYQIAVVAKEHGIPFYVAAPFTTIDMTLPSGDSIVIEDRPAQEMTNLQDIRIAAPGISCWNPAFDVTPAHLITGIITENGCFKPGELKEIVPKHQS